MSFDTDRLYNLLPAVYRIRDAAGKDLSPGSKDKGALHALFTAISEQIAVLEDNLDQLYDDQFIETCAEWVVPYIGDLVGTKGIISFPEAPFSQRGQVAKTIAYRRRKGTAAVLEELAFDVTGWKANVVEYFLLLVTNQYLNHLRPGNLSVAPVRGRALLEYINTPFDTVPRSVDVRRISSGRGKYNIPDIGIFLWRIQSYRLLNAPAYTIDERRYTFDPLGKDVPLYNLVVTEKDITHLAEPVNVPMPLRRFPFHQSPETYYGENEKSVLIIKNGKKIVPDIAAGEKIADLVCICNLSDVEGTGPVPDWSNMPNDKIAIDPVLGRIALPVSSPPEGPVEIKTNYCYGFSANIGGGPYNRLGSFSAKLNPVLKIPADAATIQDALNSLGTGGGVIEITDNNYYDAPSGIEIAAGAKLEIRSAEGCRPVLIIDNELSIVGGTDAGLNLNGLLFCGGSIYVPEEISAGVFNELLSLRVTHCTAVPGSTPFDIVDSNPRLRVAANNTTVTISKSVIGGLRVTDTATTVISDSIIDGGGQQQVAYAGLDNTNAGGTLTVRDSTIIGRVKTRIMQLASNSIFDAEPATGMEEPPVLAERLQEGCVRFSYIPFSSRVPKRYRCQPEDGNAGIKPTFTSTRYGDPGYCQLSGFCVTEIKQGAENDMEMGVFYHLYQPIREFNLQTRLKEYLRFGLEAGIFYGS
ncbi:MAG: hypothetical protein KIT80_06410 [Chitinophagaceae bacterium]|nr:hypothetical protein [Chitinophagaceae bacterium]MCW5926528.1 hypothetical protein [Chitinophagaceae bacterium]